MVDLDNTGESLTRRSRTGYIIFLNGSLIYWFYKKIPSIETSNFGAELCAMKQAIQYVRGILYKLRMVGLTCDEPDYVYVDNKSVLTNTSAPASQLKKKTNYFAYYFVREGVAQDEWRTTYVITHDNTS